MADVLMGELAIAALLILTCGRIFFSRQINTDSLSVLSIVAFLLSILQIIAWGAKLAELLLLILSFFCVIINIHAMGRLCQQLLIDRYQTGFVISSFIFLCLSIALTVCLIYFRPVKIEKKDFPVTKKIEIFQGNFKEGFTDSAKFYEKKDCILYTFNPSDKNLQQKAASNPVILFLPDRKVDVAGYEPYLLSLSQEGFTVLSADYFVKGEKWINPVFDIKYFHSLSLLFEYLFHRNTYNASLKRYSDNMQKEYVALLQFAEQKYPGKYKFILVSDGMGKKAAANAFLSHSTSCLGLFDLGNIPNFTYSGLGCVEQMDIWLAHWLHLKRDKTFFIPRYLALETKKFILEQKAVTEQFK